MKKFKIFILVVLAAVLGGFFWWQWAVEPASSLQPAPSEIFVIRKGEGLTSVANRLGEKDLIKSSLAFKILVLVKGLAGQVQAGDFRLRPSLTTEEVAYILTHGTLDVWLTFPEGWRREEFGRRLASNLEEFDLQEFLDLTEKLEGYLFPDTYLLPKEASPSAAVEILTKNFDKKFTTDLEMTARVEGLTKRQVVIFASIIEKEAKNDKDRALIAGILLKRWRANWPLQADATVQYVTGSSNDWWPKVTKRDLQLDSPYNTYRYRGLPPMPICNPGLASIKAVIDPQESDYWFYLADELGIVHYAETNEKHNENIQMYLK